MTGSRIFSMLWGSGQRDGLSTSISVPSVMPDVVAHARGGGDQIQFVLALQALLDDLHVQQAEEAAAKAESQGNRAFRLEEEGGIVEAQLFERVAQQGVLMGVDRVEAGEDHGLDVFESGQRGRGRGGRRR